MQEGKTQIRFFEEYFNFQQLDEFRLNLHITDHSVAYCVFDPHKNKYVGIAGYQDTRLPINLEDIFSIDHVLKSAFVETRVMFTNSLFTLVPDDLYDEAVGSLYRRFNVSNAQNYFEESNQLTGVMATNFFCVQRAQRLVVNKYLERTKIYHSSTPLLEGILHENKGQLGPKMYVLNWNAHTLEVVAIDGDKLILYNHFPINSLEEYIYFPLYVCQQIGFERNSVQVMAGGLAADSAEHQNMLKKYFRGVSMVRLSDQFVYSPGFEKISGTLAYSLVYLASCAS